jgi:BolA family transcriptional regulator, general stress-responsive regulator
MDMQHAISDKLNRDFSPLFIEVLDESHMHNVPEGSQSHFKVTLVSERFSGKPLIQRHRAVNASLDGDIRSAIHALALHTLTPEEWFAKGGSAPDSPPCLGGGKNQ